MSEIETNEPGGFNRRTAIKGAAWAVPVIAAAVAAPMASASVVPDWNATVSGNCSGNFDLALVESAVGPLLAGTVAAALQTLLGLQPNASRSFTITAAEGDVPVGTVYQLQGPEALISLTALQGVLDLSLLGLVEVGPGAYNITLEQPLTQGTSHTIDLFGAIADVGVADSFTLTQLVDDSNNLDNSATVNSGIGAQVNLGDLNIPLLSGSLTVQLCG